MLAGGICDTSNIIPYCNPLVLLPPEDATLMVIACAIAAKAMKTNVDAMASMKC
jgi:hypothetical protein